MSKPQRDWTKDVMSVPSTPGGEESNIPGSKHSFIIIILWKESNAAVSFAEMLLESLHPWICDLCSTGSGSNPSFNSLIPSRCRHQNPSGAARSLTSDDTAHCRAGILQLPGPRECRLSAEMAAGKGLGSWETCDGPQEPLKTSGSGHACVASASWTQSSRTR